MDEKFGPTTRTQKKEIKILEANEANGMDQSREQIGGRLLPAKLLEDGTLPRLLGLPYRRQWGSTEKRLMRPLRVLEFLFCDSINLRSPSLCSWGFEGLLSSRLARQFHSVVRDVKEFKKGKSSAIIEQRVGDHLGGFNSPHHQRPFDNVSTYEYHGMPVHKSHPFHEDRYQERRQVKGGRRGGLGGRGYYRPQ
ncbi:hypothetical protein M9H77_31139 [Catharanthus roseus]|uniref:Uncharacterized protein n=1 Tax=Catharanthus roseus TaxID=4058 RepID=A0ACB9ZZA0_CATRO|nr:hypothetical protein M9H77_31139 [Catharanthus roseus]